MIEKFSGEKKKQIIFFAAVIGLGFGLIFLFNYLFSGPQKKSDETTVQKIEVAKPEKMEEESFKKIYSNEMAKLKSEVADLRKEKESLQQQQGQKAQQAGSKSLPMLPSVPPPPPPLLNQQQPSLGIQPGNGSKQEPEERLLKDLIKTIKPQQPRAEEKKSEAPIASTVLPAGALVKSVLISGVDAPTGGKGIGNPHPVLLKVMDRAFLPNKFRADIVDCVFVGAAYGELSSERAYIRVEKLSCMTEDGKTIERDMTGYASGEDGKVGLAGEVITKQGQILARALIAGFLEGAGKLLQQSSSTIITSPSGALSTVKPEDVLQAGLASGVTEAAKKLAEFYMKLANEMFPVIEINAMRKVDVVLLSKVEV